eukprot:TRINITY_DN3586_c0_g1_i5.p2 TRINITY_DN3586_c0_g1~~TRINITY_DN3586_c0_g1_i5.p2  ORF type:complete len:216 (-),score=6.40 TRINITY_DN3586_c0_g1_i5:991-1638(-)
MVPFGIVGGSAWFDCNMYETPQYTLCRAQKLRLGFKMRAGTVNLSKKQFIVRCEYVNQRLAKLLVSMSQRREAKYPNFQYSKDQALKIQLESLQNNDDPYIDHGVEVLYRFASFDPWTRCRYFGKSQDMGQFERFRRMFHNSAYSALLNHTYNELQDTLQVSDTSWMQNVQIMSLTGQVRLYSFFMVQKVGGRYDGYWYTERLIPTEKLQLQDTV